MGDFFREDNGNPSGLRLMCFLVVMSAIGFGVFGVANNSEVAQELATTFLFAALGGKVAQKPFEKK